MCDYSLHHVSSRPAKVADKLVTMELAKSNVRGFAAVGELGPKLVIHDRPPEIAVCLLPGTELAFDENVRYERSFTFLGIGFSGKACVEHKVASFRKIDEDNPHVQHDALEFPNGQVLKINRLLAGQTATVLQLPVNVQDDHDHKHVEQSARDSRRVLNRSSVKSGVSSLLVPSLETVMLWDAVRGKAIDLWSALAQSSQRLTARKQSRLDELMPADADAAKSEVSFFQNGVPAKKPEGQTRERVKVKSAA
ncbi:MAG: hypothetical protein KGL35_20560 [Bradyrhizobium sp.]|nr:hypothetical protein [Pseudomonadota bacterium]MDE2471066.1 hypothetical protein [Bradyrhizobium sp.]